MALLHVAASAPGAQAMFCLPLALVPRRGPLTTTDGVDLDAQVVTVARQRGLVLLQLPGSTGRNTIPLPVRAAATLSTGDRLQARDDGWHTDGSVSLAAPLGGATELRLGGQVPLGAVLLFEDHAVAYAVGGRRALPLDPLLPWLRRAGVAAEMTFTELQKELRSRDPQLILEDAGALLAKRPTTMKQIEDALTLLEQGQYLTQAAATTKAFTDLLRQAHHQRVRVQSRIDGVQALIAAKQALLRFPDHGGILADAVVLTIDHGDPADAATLYRQLLQVSPEHARNVADDVAAGLQRTARSRRRARRNQEALVLLAEAVQLFPQRADMHLAYAQALAAAGRDYDALAEASVAAQLDPSYSRYLSRYQRAATQSKRSGSGTYVIPYDPKTRMIKAQASVGGQAVRFLVDTGASLTTVPTAVADRLGLRKKTNPRAKVTTASGVMEVEVVVLPSLKLGKIRLRKVQAAVLDLPGESLAGTGLLGLNALQRLNMEIDSENSRLILKQRRKRR
ncbi:MAG: retropepsin-like aspartic protease family protein [Planctomycetota bacterium]